MNSKRERKEIFNLLPVSLILQEVGDDLLLLGADELHGEAGGGESVAWIGVHLSLFRDCLVVFKTEVKFLGHSQKGVCG